MLSATKSSESMATLRRGVKATISSLRSTLGLGRMTSVSEWLGDQDDVLPISVSPACLRENNQEVPSSSEAGPSSNAPPALGSSGWGKKPMRAACGLSQAVGLACSAASASSSSQSSAAGPSASTQSTSPAKTKEPGAAPLPESGWGRSALGLAERRADHERAIAGGFAALDAADRVSERVEDASLPTEEGPSTSASPSAAPEPPASKSTDTMLKAITSRNSVARLKDAAAGRRCSGLPVCAVGRKKQASDAASSWVSRARAEPVRETLCDS
jgi:hypothetical protein